ncbi:hypothetical protein [Polyangium fumosum]|uniref:Cyclic nucleotide-binding domain-containing protein n=1 Tax=Polyangium fumosum TaxID=889272 RepID=A0A4U1JFD6_9BACT|nr:hypothetical protein [Polyangium fumosum]TKD09971.1 hypothetical protein E8A74_10205 [Polyangium fumosum]
MAELSVTLPDPRPDDAEDVVWGLSTAKTLWARGERRDAVVWLRRAAEAAESSGNVFRASELGMYAQELDDALAAAPAADVPPPPRAPLPSFDIEFDPNTGTPPPAHVRPAIVPPAPLPPMAPPPVPPPQATTPQPPSAVPHTMRPPSMAPPPLPPQTTPIAPSPGSLRPPPPPSVLPPAASFVASPPPSVAPLPPPVSPIPPAPLPEGDLLAPPSRPPSVRPPPRSVTPPPMSATTARTTSTPPPGPGKSVAPPRKTPLRSPILDPWSEGDPQSANLPRGEEPVQRRKSPTGESSASLARPRLPAVHEDDGVLTSAAPLEQTLGKKRAVPPPLPGGTALAASPASAAAPPAKPPPPPLRASSPANPAVAPPVPSPASVRPPVPPQPPSVRPPPLPPPVAEAPNEAAAPLPPPVPAAPEPPAPAAAAAPAPAAEASGSNEPAAAPQPGQLATQAAAVPQKQGPRTPSVPPKAPTPAIVQKSAGPATTPSPPVLEPRTEAKTQPPVLKADAPPPEAPKAPTPTKPAIGGINPAARRALADTLQSPIPASALRVPKPPTVATQPAPDKEPGWAVPPPAKTAPAVPDAMKRSGTTMPPPAPPRPAASPAGRAALTALKPDAAQPVAEAPKAEAPKAEAPKAEAPKPAPPAAAEQAPLSSGPPRIGDVMLEAIEPLTDLPEDVQRALSRAAKLEELGPGQTRALGVMLVIAGDVSVYATDATVPGHVAGPRSFLTSRGSFEGGFSMRFVTGASGAKIASWDEATFDHALRSCPWVLDDCKASADRLQARAGLALGALGGLDAKTRDALVTRLDMRVRESGEMITQENEPMPGLVFVVGGGVEILEGDPPAVVGEARAGELLFADALWAGVPAPLSSRAMASGVILLVGDRKLALELAADVPLIAELLAR